MRRFRRNPHAAGRVIDGQAFVVTPADNKLHTLNGAATRLWDAASKAAVSVEDAAAVLVGAYEVDEATARADAGECLEDLVARQIFVVVE